MHRRPDREGVDLRAVTGQQFGDRHKVRPQGTVCLPNSSSYGLGLHAANVGESDKRPRNPIQFHTVGDNCVELMARNGRRSMPI